MKPNTCLNHEIRNTSNKPSNLPSKGIRERITNKAQSQNKGNNKGQSRNKQNVVIKKKKNPVEANELLF